MTQGDGGFAPPLRICQASPARPLWSAPVCGQPRPAPILTSRPDGRRCQTSARSDAQAHLRCPGRSRWRNVVRLRSGPVRIGNSGIVDRIRSAGTERAGARRFVRPAGNGAWCCGHEWIPIIDSALRATAQGVPAYNKVRRPVLFSSDQRPIARLGSARSGARRRGANLAVPAVREIVYKLGLPSRTWLIDRGRRMRAAMRGKTP